MGDCENDVLHMANFNQCSSSRLPKLAHRHHCIYSKLNSNFTIKCPHYLYVVASHGQCVTDIMHQSLVL